MKVVYAMLFVAVAASVVAQDLNGTWKCDADPEWDPNISTMEVRARPFRMTIRDGRPEPFEVPHGESRYGGPGVMGCYQGRIGFFTGGGQISCLRDVNDSLSTIEWSLRLQGPDTLRFQSYQHLFALCKREKGTNVSPIQTTPLPAATRPPQARSTRASPGPSPTSLPRTAATRTPRPRVVKAPFIKDARLRFIAGPGDSDVDQVTLFDAESSSVGWAVGRMGMTESSGRRKLGWTIRNSLNCTIKVSFTLWYGDSKNKNPYPNIDFVGKDFEIGPSDDKRLSFLAEEGRKGEGFTLTIQSYAYDCK